MSRITSAVSQVTGKNIQTVSPKTEMKETPESSRKDIPKDEFTLSEGWPDQTELKKAVVTELATLQKDFSKVHIVIGTGIDEKNLASMAAGLGAGKHLIISGEWLEQMSKDAESFEKGKTILRQVLTQLSKDSEGILGQGAYIGEDEVKVWAAKDPAKEEKDDPYAEEKRVIEQMKKMTEDMKNAKNKSRITVSASAFSVSGIYSRLAGARSKGQVQAAMGDARRSMGNLRTVVSLQKKRNARKISDRGIAMEGHLADANHAVQFRNRDEEERYMDYSPFGAAAAAVLEMPIDTIAAGADMSGGIAVSDISVSAGISFDQILA